MKPTQPIDCPKSSRLHSNALATLLAGITVLGACTGTSSVDVENRPILVAELGPLGERLVVNDLADHVSADEAVFLSGDSEWTLSRSTEWLSNNRGELSEVEVWSVDLDADLRASIEDNAEFTVDVGGADIAAVVVDEQSFEVEKSSSDTAELCYNNARNRSYSGYYGSHFRIINRSSGLAEWFCSYRGTGEYPSGRRYRYRCGRCVYP